jgi:hypothetical protein
MEEVCIYLSEQLLDLSSGIFIGILGPGVIR